MDMVRTDFVMDAGDAGKCRVGLSDDPMHRLSYRPVGYKTILKNVVISTGLYTNGKDAGVFAAWVSLAGSFGLLPKKDFQGTVTIPYYRTKAVQGEIVVDYKATAKNVQITNVTHNIVDAD